jgi:hypothetical protein
VSGCAADDGFRGRLASGCDSRAACDALLAQAEQRWQACERRGSNPDCTRERRDQNAASAMAHAIPAQEPARVRMETPRLVVLEQQRRVDEQKRVEDERRRACASDRAERVAARRAYEKDVADAPVRAAERRAYAKAHCRVVTLKTPTGDRELYYAPNGAVMSAPEIVEESVWRCPKGAPEGIDGEPTDSSLQVSLVSPPMAGRYRCDDLDAEALWTDAAENWLGY